MCILKHDVAVVRIAYDSFPNHSTFFRKNFMKTKQMNK